MNEALTSYFGGEKNAGLVLAVIGALMLVAAILFLPSKYELRAFAITSGVWGLLELGIGAGLFLKTGGQVAALQTQLAADRTTMIASERPRMEKVQRNFIFLEAAWVASIVIAAVVAWRFKESLTPSGIALGSLINASVLLVFDIVAERRGAVWLEALK